MTSKNDGSAKGSSRPAPDSGESKKPSALLDLKATEVSSKPPAGATTSADKPAVQPASKSGAQPASPSGPSAQASATGAKPSDPKPNDTKPAAPGPGSSLPPAGAAKSGSPADGAPTPGTAPKTRVGVGLGRTLTHVAAGLVGGFLALLLADAAGPRLGVGTGAPQAVVVDLQKRLAIAEEALRNQSQTAMSADLHRKLDGLEQQAARLDDLGRAVGRISDAQAKIAGDTRSLQEKLAQPVDPERIAKLEQMLNTLTAAAGTDQANRIPQLAAITGKLADLEATLPNQVAELRKSLAQDFEARLAQTAQASEAARSATLRMDRELAAAKGDLARLSQRAEGFKATDERLEQSLRALQEEAGSLRSSLDGLRSDLASQLKSVARAQDVTASIGQVIERMAALEQNLQGVVKGEEDRRTNAERIVLSLELGNLKRALDRGGSFAAELAEVRKVAGGKIDLAMLERFKDTGVTTLAELTRGFRPVAHAAIDAASLPADASTLERLLQGAKSVVRVRRVDAGPEDTSAEAVVARMERALADGRLTDVLSEAKRLPPAAYEAAEPWLAKVEARAAVDRTLATVEDQLKASLSGRAADQKRVQ